MLISVRPIKICLVLLLNFGMHVYPYFQIFKVLALSVKEAREGINSLLFRILNEHQNQHEKLNKQREYFGF